MPSDKTLLVYAYLRSASDEEQTNTYRKRALLRMASDVYDGRRDVDEVARKYGLKSPYKVSARLRRQIKLARVLSLDWQLSADLAGMSEDERIKWITMRRPGKVELYKFGLEKASAVPRECATRVLESLGISHWRVWGSYRRGAPVVNDLDILGEFDLTGTDAVKITSGSKVSRYLVEIKPGLGLQLDIYALPELSSIPPFQVYISGPGSLNVKLRSRWSKLGLKLNRYGLFDAEGKRVDKNWSRLDYYRKVHLEPPPVAYSN